MDGGREEDWADVVISCNSTSIRCSKNVAGGKHFRNIDDTTNFLY